MALHAAHDKGLRYRWEQLAAKKTTILSHCEKYAGWTLPYMFPEDNHSPDAELPMQIDSLGAQGVNHLANKIVSTLFPAKTLFFRLVIDQRIRDMIEMGVALLAEQQGGTNPQDTRAALEAQIAEAEQLLLKAEKRAEEHLDMVKYRPQAINAVKLLIITGNALVFHPEDGNAVQVYNLRNYHVVRDCNGEVVEMMTRETKAFETFNAEVQGLLRSDETFRKQSLGPEKDPGKKYEDSTEVTIYTQIKLHDDGKFHVCQYADEVRLNTDIMYTKADLRWIPLTWNLVQGEDYGRGLVGDFSGAFHASEVINGALLNVGAVLGDIKFLVDPASQLDVVELQNGLPGSYHSGKPADVGTPMINKLPDAQFLGSLLERYEKQIAQAFMLTQQLRRQAERVTAEEIRQDVDELETSHSGVYSRLAADWQVPTAHLALQDTEFEGIGEGIAPRVITGMDSLSRSGEAYNLRLFMSDLAMLNSVPEDVRMAIKKPAYIQQIASYHSVNYQSWVMTDTELAQQQAQQMEQQAQLQQQQIDGQAEIEATKSAAQQM